MNKLIKSIGCTILFGAIASLAVAQTEPPGAQIIDGDLYTTDDPPVLIAAAPTGTVNESGDLDLGGGNIVAKPTASVLPDGSLDVNNNGVFDEGVDIAPPALGSLSWMGLAGQTPVESNADGDWYYSAQLKYVFHWKNYDQEGGGWYFIEEFGKNFFIFTEEGRSLSTGFFAFTFRWASRGPNAAVGAVAADDPERGVVADPNTFMFFFPSNGVTLNVPTPEDVLRTWIWIFTPHIDTGDTTAQSHFFREFEDGNKLIRYQGNTIKLSAPVGYPNN
jgi:hypothetical protein